MFDTNKVVEAARKLRRADPQLYEEFLRLMDAWTFDVTVAVTRADSGNILQVQGRAQHAQAVMAVFGTAATDPVAQPQAASPFPVIP
jgi:hypothetical protein